MNQLNGVQAEGAVVAAGQLQQAFMFPCPSCSHVIDATTAAWCLCMVKRPSAVCGACQTCLCKSGPYFNREFWNLAPASVVARNAEERRLRASRATVTGNTIDVLVVDDDEEIRTVAAFMIQEMGYSVLTATDATQALQMMETVAPVLVLTDALMPKVDGRQLCRTIKSSFPDVRVVIMTALYTSPRYKHEAIKTFHADDYVAKPIDFARLGEVVGRMVPRLQRAVA